MAPATEFKHLPAPRAVTVVLLAAGESSRMGQPKQTLPWQGIPLLYYQAVQALALPMLSEAIVVLGSQAEDWRGLLSSLNDKRLRFVVNWEWQAGKTSSIRAGILAMRMKAAAVLVLAVDQPRPASMLTRLAQAHLDQARAISVPTYAGKRGHPPILAAALVPELLRISEEREGLREVLERHAQEVHEVEMESPLVLVNLNTPEDYEKALSFSTIDA